MTIQTPPLATRNVSFISQNHTRTIPHCCLSPWFDLCEMQRCAAEKELDRGDRSLEAQVRENGRSVKGTGEFELDDVSTFVPKTNAANSMRIVATNADSKFIAGPQKIIQTENPVWHARKWYSALQANIGSNSATTCSLPCCLVMLCSSLVKKTKIRNQKGYTNSPPRHFFKKCPLRSPWTGPKRAHFKIHWGCLWQTSQISPSLSWIETVYHFLSSLSAAHPQHLHEFPLYSVWSHLIPPG